MTTRTNPYTTAAADWQMMADALQFAEDQRREADQLNISLLAQNKELQKQLDEVNEDRKYLMAYLSEITTRLDVVIEAINGAKVEATKHAKDAYAPTNRQRKEGEGARPVREIRPVHDPETERAGRLITGALGASAEKLPRVQPDW